MIDSDVWKQLERAVVAVRQGDLDLFRKTVAHISDDGTRFTKIYTYASGALYSVVLNDLFGAKRTGQQLQQFAETWLPVWRRILPAEDAEFENALRVACMVATDDETRDNPPRLEHVIVALACLLEATNQPLDRHLEQMERGLAKREQKYGPW